MKSFGSGKDIAKIAINGTKIFSKLFFVLTSHSREVYGKLVVFVTALNATRPIQLYIFMSTNPKMTKAWFGSVRLMILLLCTREGAII